MGLLKSSSSVVVGAMLTLSAAVGAQAATQQCEAGDWRYRLGAATQVQCLSGNDTNTITSTFSLLGQTGWILADKTDGGGNGHAELTLTGEDQTAQTPGWTIDLKGSTFQYLMITLKQAGGPTGGFGAFLIAANTLSGTWETLKEKKNSNPIQYEAKNDISHASLYYIGKGTTTVVPPPTTPIPLPAGAWLALTALGGFAVLRRRKAHAAA